ncbi:MAG: uridine kinase [Acidimicrobiales bacterium]
MSLVIGICGGSGSGKTTLAAGLAARIESRLGPGSTSSLSFDSYYRELDHLTLEQRAAVNFDHPDSLDGDLLAAHLDSLRRGVDIAAPRYDFTRHARTDDVQLVSSRPVVIVEGILLFAFDPILAQLDFRVFRRCPEPVRFQRRLERDVVERGRSERSVLDQLAATVKPMHDRYVEACAPLADIVTDHGQDLETACHDIAEHVLDTLTPAPA